VAYVFVHLLPELSEGQEANEEELNTFPFLERHVYLVALLGMTLFYGLERSARQSRRRRRASPTPPLPSWPETLERLGSSP
jgi:hypothetical protein